MAGTSPFRHSVAHELQQHRPKDRGREVHLDISRIRCGWVTRSVALMNAHRSGQFVALALWVGGGALIGVATAGADASWYTSLDKPSWTLAWSDRHLRSSTRVELRVVPDFLRPSADHVGPRRHVALWLLIVMAIRMFVRAQRAAGVAIDAVPGMGQLRSRSQRRHCVDELTPRTATGEK
jgi:hypothetical protein